MLWNGDSILDKNPPGGKLFPARPLAVMIGPQQFVGMHN
jgi:hypothetical protein